MGERFLGLFHFRPGPGGGLRLVRSFHADRPVAIPGDEHGDVEDAITRAEWETAPP